MNLLCPHCEHRFEADDSQADREVSCPSCSGTFTAPPPAGAGMTVWRFQGPKVQPQPTPPEPAPPEAEPPEAEPMEAEPAAVAPDAPAGPRPTSTDAQPNQPLSQPSPFSAAGTPAGIGAGFMEMNDFAAPPPRGGHGWLLIAAILIAVSGLTPWWSLKVKFPTPEEMANFENDAMNMQKDAMALAEEAEKKDQWYKTFDIEGKSQKEAEKLGAELTGQFQAMGDFDKLIGRKLRVWVWGWESGTGKLALMCGMVMLVLVLARAGAGESAAAWGWAAALVSAALAGLILVFTIIWWYTCPSRDLSPVFSQGAFIGTYLAGFGAVVGMLGNLREGMAGLSAQLSAADVRRATERMMGAQ